MHRIFQTHILFVIIALVFGLAFIFVIPPYWGVDEDVHFDRAYQISTGVLLEKKLPTGLYGGYLPTGIVVLNNDVKSDLLAIKGNVGEVNSRQLNIYNRLDATKLSGKVQTRDFTGSGVYSPLAYLAPALGIVISRAIDPTVGSVLVGARLATLFAYVAIVSGALYLLRNHRSRWLVFVVALLPMSIFQASIINVDSLAIGLSIMLFAQLIVIWTQKKELNNRQLAWLTLTAMGLTLSKPNYFILVLAICFLPVRLLGQRRKLYVRFLLPILITLVALFWNHEINNVMTVSSHRLDSPVFHISASVQLKHIILHPLNFAYLIVKSLSSDFWDKGVFGVLGYNFVSLPTFIISYLAIVLSWAAFYKDGIKSSVENVRQGIVFGCVAVLAGLSIITTLYLTYNTIGAYIIDGVQGRYFLPILPFMLYGLSQILPIRTSMSERWMKGLLSCSLIVCLAFSLAWYYKITYG